MQIARSSTNNPIATWIVILTCPFGGVVGFFSLGRLEDPAFPIKTATVVTLYPGATAGEVAHEVTEKLESEIQKMSVVDKIDIKRPFPAVPCPRCRASCARGWMTQRHLCPTRPTRL
ncbi:efflux RND transporter permease subunit [Ruegeria sp. 2205SS24-7]|uniref:efflux RND transporter permease subunit n=1 Tax=Ruegeria discodermiae TaxID=3064389 RepID=UPI0027420CED|nr:efflux RND transporter permease subunit [Ruegeria sp. 2205SS24-7]MDP5216975.1 efflux RND transporter permease subunit [Ruegeria sp. 2205SS24-7]